MRHSDAALLVVVGMVLLAGCAEMTTTTEVAADGEIEELTVQAEVEKDAYESFEAEVEESGHDSVESFLEDEVTEGIGDSALGSVTTATEPVENDRYLLTVTVTHVNPDALGDVTVTVEDGTMYYESTDVFNRNFAGNTYEFDDAFDDDNGFGINDDLFGGVEDGDNGYGESLDELFEEYEEDIWIEYSVTMPGEIIDHNAHQISDDDRTATWGYMGDEIETVYVESEIDGINGDDGSDDGANDSTGSDDGGADDESTDDGGADDDGDDSIDSDDEQTDNESTDDGGSVFDDGGVFDDTPSDDGVADEGDTPSDDGNDHDDDGGSVSDSIPGFGISAIVFSSLLAGAILVLRLR
ncbi:hypothetical protein OB905_04355 [Halobacteria archaeon AArc-dxtr1]|nr:hypothetical protein [Halobacteria archaeon AArc-dxtr1]